VDDLEKLTDAREAVIGAAALFVFLWSLRLSFSGTSSSNRMRAAGSRRHSRATYACRSCNCVPVARFENNE
jgi:hypothetical protein